MHLVRLDIWTFGPYVIWPVTVLLHMPFFIICVARTGPYLCSTIIGSVIALLYGQTFGCWDFISFGLLQPCCTIIGPVIDLLHVSLGIILVALNGLYLRSTLLWYLVPVPAGPLWHVLGHFFFSRSYLSTRVPLTP